MKQFTQKFSNYVKNLQKSIEMMGAEYYNESNKKSKKERRIWENLESL